MFQYNDFILNLIYFVKTIYVLFDKNVLIIIAINKFNVDDIIKTNENKLRI